MFWTDPEIDALTIGILREYESLDHEKLRTMIETGTRLTSMVVIDNSISRVSERSEEGSCQLKKEVIERLEKEKGLKASKT